MLNFLYLQKSFDGIESFLVASPLCVSISQPGSNTGDDEAIEYNANDHTNQSKGHLSINQSINQ